MVNGYERANGFNCLFDQIPLLKTYRLFFFIYYILIFFGAYAGLLCTSLDIIGIFSYFLYIILIKRARVL